MFIDPIIEELFLAPLGAQWVEELHCAPKGARSIYANLGSINISLLKERSTWRNANFSSTLLRRASDFFLRLSEVGTASAERTNWSTNPHDKPRTVCFVTFRVISWIVLLYEPAITFPSTMVCFGGRQASWSPPCG